MAIVWNSYGSPMEAVWNSYGAGSLQRASTEGAPSSIREGAGLAGGAKANVSPRAKAAAEASLRKKDVYREWWSPRGVPARPIIIRPLPNAIRPLPNAVQEGKNAVSQCPKSPVLAQNALSSRKQPSPATWSAFRAWPATVAWRPPRPPDRPPPPNRRARCPDRAASARGCPKSAGLLHRYGVPRTARPTFRPSKTPLPNSRLQA